MNESHQKEKETDSKIIDLKELLRNRKVFIVLLGFVLCVSTAYQIAQIQKVWPRYDSAEHLVMAWNILENGTLSLDRNPTGKAVPTAYRMPGYPSFLAIVYRITHLNIPKDVNTVLLEPKTALTIATILVFELTLLLGAFVLNKFTGKPLLSVVFIAILGFKSPFLHQLNFFFAEYWISFLVMTVSFLLYRACVGKKRLQFLLAGAMSGILALTRAPFVYLPAFVIILILFFGRQFNSTRQTLISAVLFLVGFAVLVSPWMIRNKVHFGNAMLTARGAGVLQTRLSINQMTKREMIEGLYAWTKSGMVRHIIARFSGHPEWENRKNVRGLDPFFTYERRVKQYQIQFEKQHPQMGEMEREQLMRKHAISELFRDQFALNLIRTPLFAYCGIQQYSSLLLNLLLFGSLLILSLVLFIQGNAGQALFYLPAVFLFLFLSALTFNLSRYSLPVLPIAWIGLLQVTSSGWDAVTEKRERGRARKEGNEKIHIEIKKEKIGREVK